MALNSTTNFSLKNSEKLILNCLTLHNEYPLYGWYKYNWIVVASFNLVLAPFAALLNLIILVVILKNRRLQSISNILLMNLCLTDLLTGFIAQPMFAAITIISKDGIENCPLFVTGVIIGYYVGTLSYLTLLTIWTDRYFAIFHPFRYIEWASKGLVIKVLAVLWITCALLVSLSLLTKEFLLHSIFTMITVPISFGWSFYVQLKTMYIVRRLQRQTSTTENTVSDSVKGNSNSQATKVAATILITICVCNFPHCVVYIWGYLFTRPDGLYVAFGWTTTLLLVNSSWNPIIYCLKMTEIREKVFELLKGFKRDDPATSEQSTVSVINA